MKHITTILAVVLLNGTVALAQSGGSGGSGGGSGGGASSGSSGTGTGTSTGSPSSAGTPGSSVTPGVTAPSPADGTTTGRAPGTNPSNPQDLQNRSNPQDLTKPGGANPSDQTNQSSVPSIVAPEKR